MANQGIYTNSTWVHGIQFNTSENVPLALSGTYECDVLRKGDTGTPVFTFNTADGTLDHTDQAIGSLILTATPAQHQPDVTAGKYMLYMRRVDGGSTTWAATGEMVVGKPGDTETYIRFDAATDGSTASTYVVAVAGPQGPANVLSIGTVTTGAPSSSAAATITGTSPTQVLNLTIPRGPISTMGQDTASFTSPSEIVMTPDTSNVANPDETTTGLATTADHLHRVYNSGGGALSAQLPTVIGNLAVTRKYTVTAGETYTLSFHEAPTEWIIYFTGSPFIGFYNTDGSHHSNITSGFTRGTGDRSVTFTVPSGAERVAFNVQNSIDFSNANPMTEAGLDELLPFIMLNVGSSALDYAPYSDGTFTPSSATFDPEQSGDVEITRRGTLLYVRAPCQNSATTDVVWRLKAGQGLLYDATYSRSGVIDLYGIRFISRSAISTVAAFNQSTQVHSNGFDESAPVKFNNVYLGGGHGVPGTKITAAAHGKANVDVGSIWNDGTNDWVLYRVDSTSALTFVRKYTGATDKWEISGATMGTVTLTHVSGATNTGSISATSPTAAQVVPALKSYLYEVQVDGAAVTGDGTWAGDSVTLREVYSILNAASQQDFLIANVGDPTPSYDDASIAEQVRVFNEYTISPAGSLSVRTAIGCHQAHRRTSADDYWGGIQLQRLALTGDSTPGMQNRVDLYVPDISTVSGYDLQAGANITSNASDVRVPRSSCTTPTDPASHFALIGYSSGTAVAGHLFGYDRAVGNGIPATRAAEVTNVLFFSSAEKMYPIAVDSASGDAAAGDVVEVGAFRAPFLPDASLTIPGVIVETGGNTYCYITSHQNLTSHLVEIPDRFDGFSVTVIKSHTNVTVIDTVVINGGVRVTVTGGYGDVVLKLAID